MTTERQQPSARRPVVAVPERAASDSSGHESDGQDDDVRQFVEQFALVMTESGIPRMPARVFACVLAEDRGRLTARELSERLLVSPAAVSGAVRYLITTGLLQRDRRPGERVDHYRFGDDQWYEMYANRDALLKRWEDAAGSGAGLLGLDTPAGRRLRESQEFFGFLRAEFPGVMQRWREHRARALAELDETSGDEHR